MGTFLKQPKQKTPKQRAARKQEDAPSRVVVTGPDVPGYTSAMQHDINHVAGLGDLQDSLDWIARGLSRFTDDEHSVGVSLSTGYKTDPVKITLSGNDYDDTMDRFVTAVERIADSVAKLAGLNRPRLESWHEQEEYEPRYKDIACDGGAPGPKTDATHEGEGGSDL
jgi:hypothetical protein